MKAKLILLGITLLLVGLLAVGCGAKDEPAQPAPTPPPPPAEVTASTYVGSDSCKTCHSKEFNGWEKTAHPFMIQSPDEMWPEARTALQAELDKGDSGFLAIGGTDQKLESMDQIVYIVGHWLKQRYVIRTDDGHRFVQTQYYPDGNEGSKLYGYSEARVYEDRCLACHSTGFDFDAAQSLDRTAAGYGLESVVAEFGVGCEACHGPGSEHVNARGGKDNILNPANFTVQQQNDFCGSCHARNSGSVNYSGRNDAVNFQLGDVLSDHVKIQSVVNNNNVFKKVVDGKIQGYYQDEAGETQRWWDDATARSHRMQYNDMESSLKFGIMSCNTCHDMHNPSGLVGGSWEGLLAADLGSNSCATCHKSEIEAGWDIDEAMPKNARSQNVKDIRIHSFGPAKPSADIPETK